MTVIIKHRKRKGERSIFDRLGLLGLDMFSRPKGVFEIEVIDVRTGKVVARKNSNRIVDGGAEHFRDSLFLNGATLTAADAGANNADKAIVTRHISHFQMGTGGSTATADDTDALSVPIAATTRRLYGAGSAFASNVSFKQLDAGARGFLLEVTFGSTEINQATPYTEAGLFLSDGTNVADGVAIPANKTMFARVVFGDILKSNVLALKARWRVTFT